jgi:hypothetical protein
MESSYHLCEACQTCLATRATLRVENIEGATFEKKLNIVNILSKNKLKHSNLLLQNDK